VLVAASIDEDGDPHVMAAWRMRWAVALTLWPRAWAWGWRVSPRQTSWNAGPLCLAYRPKR